MGELVNANLSSFLLSSENFGMAPVHAIMHFAIQLPLHWLARDIHTNKIAELNWSLKSISHSIDILEAALIFGHAEIFLRMIL